VNIVIPNSKSVVAEAIKLAEEITANSPDAVQAAKHGLLLSQNLYPMEEVVLAHVWSRHSERLYEGRNIKEGLQAFAAVCAQIFFLKKCLLSRPSFFLFFLFLSPLCVLDPRC